MTGFFDALSDSLHLEEENAVIVELKALRAEVEKLRVLSVLRTDVHE